MVQKIKTEYSLLQFLKVTPRMGTVLVSTLLCKDGCFSYILWMLLGRYKMSPKTIFNDSLTKSEASTLGTLNSILVPCYNLVDFLLGITHKRKKWNLLYVVWLALKSRKASSKS